MVEYTIDIKNCNNIRDAQIALYEGVLNIKFGYNGTGKSTISEAIRRKTEGEDLSILTPYSDKESEEDNSTYVGCIPFHRVNPEKFFSIPKVYVKEISEFLIKHRSEICV